MAFRADPPLPFANVLFAGRSKLSRIVPSVRGGGASRVLRVCLRPDFTGGGEMSEKIRELPQLLSGWHYGSHIALEARGRALFPLINHS